MIPSQIAHWSSPYALPRKGALWTRHILRRSLKVPTRASMQTPFVPAVVTPFVPSTLELDVESFKTYLKFLQEAGFQDIVVNGSTGEFASMTLAERQQVAEVARDNWAGRQFVNISSCNVKDTLQLLNHCQQSVEHLKGTRCIADGVLLLPPYYFAASTQAGLERFFTAVIQEARIPVYLYNFPANTGGLVPLELYASLAQQFPQLKGIKNTFDDLPLSKKFKAAAPDRQVMVGHDPSVLASLETGLDGAIVATGSVMPKHVLGIAAAHAKGDKQGAEHHLARLNQWNAGVEKQGVNIFSAVKAALSRRISGFPMAVRPPLEEATEDQILQLAKILESAD